MYCTKRGIFYNRLHEMGRTYFSAKEGKEAFEKAQGKNSCCDCEEDAS